MADICEKRYSQFLISGVKISLEQEEDEALKIAGLQMKRAGIDPAQLHFRVYKRSIDARKKKAIMLVYSVAAVSDEPISADERRLAAHGISPMTQQELQIEIGCEKMSAPPLVVGMGPAGLFAALLLAEHGYDPVIIDRGDDVRTRCEKNRRFIEEGVLDPDSNVQFGAGGAGTFSDGKLLTRINDARISYVLRRFCDFGAPEDILTNARPHIGTDLLTGVVSRMLLRIEELGGRVIYRCRLDGIDEMADGSIVARTTKGDIKASALVLAVGHSARDTYAMLMRKGFAISPKSFSVGVRVEHLKEDIDRALWGERAGDKRLGAGEYHLSDTTGERGVYTFCMCPGGTVVASSSECGGLVVNGMSVHARDGRNSNSAVAVSVFTGDFGNTAEGAIEYQRRLERRAFELGGRDYYAPVQTMGDFLDGRSGTEPIRVQPTYRDGRVRLARVDKIFPSEISETLRRGFLSFDKKLSGFAARDAVITGVESRTSSPVRILRTDELCALSHKNIYPCGEGAGYAGGITSAAVDGIKVAVALMRRFKSC